VSSGAACRGAHHMTSFTIRPRRRRCPNGSPSSSKRIHELAASGSVRFTLEALRELASLEVGLDEADACELLQRLRATDSAGRLRSSRTRDWLYVFLPRVGRETLYIKVLLRSDCVIISFHEQADDEEERGEG
jgi:hypothetical protein